MREGYRGSPSKPSLICIVSYSTRIYKAPQTHTHIKFHHHLLDKFFWVNFNIMYHAPIYIALWDINCKDTRLNKLANMYMTEPCVLAVDVP